MKNKEKQLVNEIKQDFKMHEEKHKQIEEMAKIIELEMCPTQKEYSKFNNKATCYFAECKNIKNAVDKLTNAGYQKIKKDSVVLSREEWKQIKSLLYYSKEELEKKLQKARKETAEHFLKEYGYLLSQRAKDEIAQQFGVDLGE